MKVPTKLKMQVLEALPKSATVQTKVFWHPTGLGRTHVLRVVTPAWKSLQRWERNHKLHEALREQEADLRSIFRISVLTPPEFEEMRDWLPSEGGERRVAKPSSTGNRRRSHLDKQPTALR
jgi:hypothetical protein